MIDYQEFAKEFMKISTNMDRLICDDNMMEHFETLRNGLQIKPNTSFFRYRSLEGDSKGHILDEIKNQRIFMSPLSNFDDKYEGKYLFDDEDILNNTCPCWVDSCNYRYRETIRVSCFTIANDMMPFWYYYANKHKGLCIEYKYRDMIWDNTVFLPVLYPNKGDRSKYKYLPRDEKDIKYGGIINALIKHKEWSFEKEWRAIQYQSVDKLNQAIYLPIKIHAIHLGEDISKEDVDIIQAIINGNNSDIQLNKIRSCNTGLKSLRLQDISKSL